MLNIEKHKNVLFKILKDIYRDNTLGPLLGFKGGTAALFLYNLNRFSVDLDFDLLDNKKEDEVFEKIEKILLKYGKIKDKQKKYYTLFFELSYSEEDYNVKIEISRRNLGSKFEILNYFGISMQVMVKEDMFANKLAALYERGERANRDIYDVWFFLDNNWPINKELIEKRLGISFVSCIEKCLLKLEKISSRSILAGLGEILDEEKKKWVKLKLKDETLFLLKLMLAEEKKKDKL